MELESQLSGGDYRVIKCAEAQAVGETLPYDAEQLHAERQQKRDRINAIEAEIAALKRLEPEEDATQCDDLDG